MGKGRPGALPDRPSVGLRRPQSRASDTQLRDVLCGRALLALHHVELDTLTLAQGLEALALDGRVMDEAVLLAALGRDEAEALRVVEPLHGAGRTHGNSCGVASLDARACRATRAAWMAAAPCGRRRRAGDHAPCRSAVERKRALARARALSPSAVYARCACVASEA